MNKIEIFEQVVKNTSGLKSKITILKGEPASLDGSMCKYVGNENNSQFISINNDIDNLRIIISNINEINFVDYESQNLKE